METNKQKAIREAYGEYWEQVKDYVDENGWCSEPSTFTIAVLFFCMKHEFTTHGDIKNNYMKSWRPISLKGIENNNNWISILSESDLPSENCDCYIEHKDGNIHIDRYFSTEKMFDAHHWKYIVAYIPIPQPNKRIY